ncbi:ankyrin repeat domain-containing protein 50 isoform X1 [Zootoca vivipara]|uniref:ankyrin repeat domain-containing protein 50 isoform X1 n=1 Tax=Zootoca vivipara TaxID=8524 RepID=UPI001590A39B|nr:ankyrin repeat domain-containing protein 50 isoform X1 [Zootoca vivipara]XP_034972284.1 ankyrin repeat domain-containing protein 50 isoform X1 [Zootoca vivipara]XP_034972285.1 ankyrin repeat domain-containing protein 50-like isoform X1 [Zootoca vivipara]
MEPSGSLLQGKPFYCREWALGRLALSLEGGGGVLVTGGPGSGKTALCTEALWPTSEVGRRVGLGESALAWHFCQPHDGTTCSPRGFLLRLVAQIQQCPLLPGYGERLSRADAQSTLENAQCKKDPDEAFRRAILLPLLDLPPPTKPLLLVVDALDAGQAECCEEERAPPPGPSRTIAQLLGSHLQLLPPWLLLVCTARSHSKGVLRLFNGFRRLCLDDLRREPVVCDVQQYILARLDREEPLRRHLTRDTAEALSQLHIKSNGCLLYLERVLDGVAGELVTLREVRHIPGTLYGLYLWLCQRLFPGQDFALVRPLLEALLAAPRPLRPTELYAAVWTRRPVPREEFEGWLASLAPLLHQGPGGTCILFHASFAEWLCDVKHCTQRYLCCPARGHASLAMSTSCRAPALLPEQVHELAHHLLHAELGMEAWQLALWLVWCGAPVERCLEPEEALLLPLAPMVLELLVLAGARMGSQGPGPSLQQALEREDSVRLLLENGASVNQRDVTGRTLLASAAHSGNHEVAGLLLARGAQAEVPDRHGQTPMTLAARQGHTKVLLCLLAHGAQVDRPDREGWTALRAAAWGGHSEAVGVLLRAGANVDCADAEGRTALRAAAWGGHEEIVATLLEHGADLNRADTEGRTALIAAAYMGHREIVGLLLAHGAHVDHADVDGRTALSVAALCVPASRGYAKVVELLLDYGAFPGHKDRDGMTPLLVAAYEGHADVVELLLEAGVDVDEADGAGCAPLLAAASMGHRAVVDTLLLWGAAVDGLDGEGRTALGVAAGQGSEAVVRALLERGLDENHRDALGWTPLHLAAWQGHARTCAALLEAGARVAETNRDGRVPLMLAAQEGHTDTVQLLLDRGSPIDHQGYDGLSALLLAMLGGHRATAELLLRKGADVNLSDAEGRPMLYLLVLEGRLEMAELLLENGAGLEGKDAQGRSALHVACWQGHAEAAQLLLSYGADIDALDTERRSALHLAAWRGHAQIARLLLEGGAHPDHACNQGATALGIAAQEGQAAVAKVLLEHGASPGVLDRAGRTPLRVAAKRGHREVLRLLEGHGAVPGSPGSVGSSPSASLDSAAGEHPKSQASLCSSGAATSSTFHSLATAQTVPVDTLSFAQQIQQHSLPRRRQVALAALPRPTVAQDKHNGEAVGSPLLLSIDTLDPHLHLKAAIKLQFEGPTCGYDYKQETPL